ncbi:MAG TPA: YggT family protein [Dehalococcoidia bacterium]|mgnify:FL=1|nr:YggT family protein [Dehalococcoidia bacterium]HIN36888.1 YggT family protein [Dehalococcoidia bacterium]
MAPLLNTILTLFTIAIFARVILTFVIPMSGANPHPILISINTLVSQVTEPVLGPIRRSLPTFGGLDFSPMAVLIILILLRRVVDAIFN